MTLMRGPTIPRDNITHMIKSETVSDPPATNMAPNGRTVSNVYGARMRVRLWKRLHFLIQKIKASAPRLAAPVNFS